MGAERRPGRDAISSAFAARAVARAGGLVCLCRTPTPRRRSLLPGAATGCLWQQIDFAYGVAVDAPGTSMLHDRADANPGTVRSMAASGCRGATILTLAQRLRLSAKALRWTRPAMSLSLMTRIKRSWRVDAAAGRGRRRVRRGHRLQLSPGLAVDAAGNVFVATDDGNNRHSGGQRQACTVATRPVHRGRGLQSAPWQSRWTRRGRLRGR